MSLAASLKCLLLIVCKITQSQTDGTEGISKHLNSNISAGFLLCLNLYFDWVILAQKYALTYIGVLYL